MNLEGLASLYLKEQILTYSEAQMIIKSYWNIATMQRYFCWVERHINQNLQSHFNAVLKNINSLLESQSVTEAYLMTGRMINVIDTCKNFSSAMKMLNQSF